MCKSKNKPSFMATDPSDMRKKPAALVLDSLLALSENVAVFLRDPLERGVELKLPSAELRQQLIR